LLVVDSRSATSIHKPVGDHPLVSLGRELRARGYSFTTVTPASHRTVNARAGAAEAASLRDIFGWSRPFRPAETPPWVVRLLADADALEVAGPLLRSKVRVSTLGAQMFVHSAFPTEAADAVFFGPDTYRFIRTIRQEMPWRPAGQTMRIVDVGCGSGAGGLCAAGFLPEANVDLVLTDINPKALAFAAVNAALNDVPRVECRESDVLASVSGKADLIVSNPPYLVDPLTRAYRHGGGDWGFDLSLKILTQSMAGLKPGGRLILYTGAPIIDGNDPFRDLVRCRLEAAGWTFRYDEIDPDVFGEELGAAPYDRADRIAVVALVADCPLGNQ
jgi:release factor glutamine methyltransferase